MEKINRISKTVSNAITFNKEWIKVKNQLDGDNLSPGKRKVLMIREKYLYDRILFYLDRLHKLIDIKSCNVIVEINGIKKTMLFNGLSKEEVITYFDGMIAITNMEIKILEISEINNQVEEL